MVGHSVGIVLVRLFSIYLGIGALQSFIFYLAPALHSLTDAGEGSLAGANWSLAIVALLPAAVAVWIWRNTEVFVPESASSEESCGVSFQTVLTGVSILGLYFLVSGIVYLVRVELGLTAVHNINVMAAWVQRAPYIAQLLLATLLILGKEWIAEFISRVRHEGNQ